MDRDAVADLLRTRRERLCPRDVGLPPGGRRRTPGLRRDEVAALAAISTDYYTRLEQRRGPHPSVAVLAGLARALRLSDDERDHLFQLCHQAAPVHGGLAPHVGPGMTYLLDRLDDTPAFVIDDLGTLLLQNRMSMLVSGDQSGLSGRDANHLWRWFVTPGGQDRCPPEDRARHSRINVADLRATAGRRGGDADVRRLVDDLTTASAEFAELWARHDVAVRHGDDKRVQHPEVGVLDLLCEKLTGAAGLTLVVLHPKPGTDCRDKLDLLSVIGTQDLRVPS